VSRNNLETFDVDRRIQKTLQSLHQALIALILEKGYEAITVQQIIDKANVGRSTFYAHFSSKEQLLQSGLDDLHRFLASQQKAAAVDTARPGEIGLSFSLALFEHASGYRDVYRAMLGQRAGAVVTNLMRSMLMDLVHQEVEGRLASEYSRDIPRGALVQYVVGALLSVLTWWVDTETPYGPREVDAIFRQLVFTRAGIAI
jgi:AcrR family transcriptional regulator